MRVTKKNCCYKTKVGRWWRVYTYSPMHGTWIESSDQFYGVACWMVRRNRSDWDTRSQNWTGKTL